MSKHIKGKKLPKGISQRSMPQKIPASSPPNRTPFWHMQTSGKSKAEKASNMAETILKVFKTLGKSGGIQKNEIRHLYRPKFISY